MNPGMNFMMNNLNNMNNMIIPNQNNQNNKEQILNLINYNKNLMNQIEMNNNMIQNMVDNSNYGNNSKNNTFWNEFGEVDFFPAMSGKRINVIFKDATGMVVNMVTPLDAKMKELLELFYIKLQIYGKLMNKKIYPFYEYNFLYRGSIIPINVQKSIREFGLLQSIETIVFNLKNVVIGG